MADLGRPDFEILRGFVIVPRQRTERHFQIGLPRHVARQNCDIAALPGASSAVARPTPTLAPVTTTIIARVA
jgi:hypothetical protein